MKEATNQELAVAECPEPLPPFGGNYERLKSKSTDRHKRETMSKVAEQVGLSTTTLRRDMYIIKFGSAEIKQALKENRLSSSRAYNIVKTEKEGQLFRALEKLSAEERQTLLTRRQVKKVKGA